MRAMLSLAVVLAALPLRFVASAQAAAAPHIVLVVSDDLGFNDLGAYPCPARGGRHDITVAGSPSGCSMQCAGSTELHLALDTLRHEPR